MKMPFEPLLFVLFAFFSTAAAQYFLWKSSLGDALSVLRYLAVALIAIFFWSFRIAWAFPGRHFVWLMLAILCPVLIVGSRLVDRSFRSKESHLFSGTAMPVFHETLASGQGCESFLLRLWRARKTLSVTVTESELWIRPGGRGAAISRIWGLAHRVNLRHIHQLEKLVSSKANIRLEYGAEDGWCRCIELQLKNPSAFVEAVREGQIEGAA